MTGKCSIFGGPNDSGMAETEGLALYEHHEADKRKDLFFPRDADQSIGTSKRLRPQVFYIAIRYDSKVLSRIYWQASEWKVSNLENGKSAIAKLVDFGPAEWTGRAIDLSPGLARELEVKTDDVVWYEEVLD